MQFSEGIGGSCKYIFIKIMLLLIDKTEIYITFLIGLVQSSTLNRVILIARISVKRLCFRNLENGGFEQGI